MSTNLFCGDHMYHNCVSRITEKKRLGLNADTRGRAEAVQWSNAQNPKVHKAHRESYILLKLQWDGGFKWFLFMWVNGSKLITLQVPKLEQMGADPCCDFYNIYSTGVKLFSKYWATLQEFILNSALSQDAILFQFCSFNNWLVYSI